MMRPPYWTSLPFPCSMRKYTKLRVQIEGEKAEAGKGGAGVARGKRHLRFAELVVVAAAYIGGLVLHALVSGAGEVW